MDFLKKVNASVLGLVVLLAFGCGGDEPEPDNTQNPDEQIFKSCRVKKMTYNGSTEFNHTYNSQGHLVATYVAGSLTETYEYNNLGKVSRHIILRSGTDTSAINTFKYNADSLVTKVISKYRLNPTDSFSISNILNIVYDSQKRRIRDSTQTFGQVNAYDTKSNYTYLTGNKVRITGFIYNTQTNSWDLSSENETTYDNQKRPNYNYNGIFGDVLNHNVVSIARTEYSAGVVTSASINTMTHTYNASGYPIESIYNTGQGVSVFKYEYDCQ
ncbi:hypothetical protein I5M27_09435 [Adhaeribacter sp. BT258]|uniref:YD repeat-containing protein n=1 Tax=Adhaeribacter terrigena TaxID=2793070 RepID=A0ABS1C1Z2_9BACT|nr:hypothetical protein [Adhaeribacter terrigena]MBK0403207.1 hypothetical protein [Adhaeribacter terrigena]